MVKPYDDPAEIEKARKALEERRAFTQSGLWGAVRGAFGYGEPKTIAEHVAVAQERKRRAAEQAEEEERAEAATRTLAPIDTPEGKRAMAERIVSQVGKRMGYVPTPPKAPEGERVAIAIPGRPQEGEGEETRKAIHLIAAGPTGPTGAAPSPQMDPRTLPPAARRQLAKSPQVPGHYGIPVQSSGAQRTTREVGYDPTEELTARKEEMEERHIGQTIEAIEHINEKTRIAGEEKKRAKKTHESRMALINRTDDLTDKYIKQTKATIEKLGGDVKKRLPTAREEEEPGIANAPKEEIKYETGLIGQTKTELEKSSAELEQARKDLKRFKIDPMKAVGAGRMFLGAIGVAMNAFATGYTKGKIPNMAASLFNNMMNRALNAQKIELDKKIKVYNLTERQRKYLNEMWKEYKDEKKVAMTRMAQLEAAKLANQDARISAKDTYAKTINALAEGVADVKHKTESPLLKEQKQEALKQKDIEMEMKLRTAPVTTKTFTSSMTTRYLKMPTGGAGYADLKQLPDERKKALGMLTEGMRLLNKSAQYWKGKGQRGLYQRAKDTAKSWFPWTYEGLNKSEQKQLAMALAVAAQGSRPTDKDVGIYVPSVIHPADAIRLVNDKRKSLMTKLMKGITRMSKNYPSDVYDTRPISQAAQDAWGMRTQYEKRSGKRPGRTQKVKQ